MNNSKGNTMNKSVHVGSKNASAVFAYAVLEMVFAIAIAVVPMIAMADDYPVMTSTGSNAQHESCFDRATNWTNPTYESVAPSSPAASAFDYLIETKDLRSPQDSLSTGGINVFHSHKFTVSGVQFYECASSGVVTNRFENEGIELGVGGCIETMNGKYGDATYEGKVTISGTNDSASKRSQLIANTTNGLGSVSILRVAGTLQGNGFLRTSVKGLGARVVIEAEAEDFTGTVVVADDKGWLTFGCSVFNGSVERWNRAAIGAERASSVVHIKNLTLNAAQSTLIVPVDAVSHCAGVIVVTNSYTWKTGSESKIIVQMRGDVPWGGDIPVLKIAPQCEVLKNGTVSRDSFYEQPVEWGGFIDDLRISRNASFSRRVTSVSMVKYAEPDGTLVLAARVEKPGIVLIVE